ncbi:Uncharacterised protein [Candidatus Venteria ishoeyi]|uniref:Uncharacterized protein n=1 Tax=Candidatus Venteria ishoeyi TaxID=1899563 RepID=A0A1H6FA49_9GAMM|nr:Uncharacterised protein [Candidatus Venteria ishoeyi]
MNKFIAGICVGILIAAFIISKTEPLLLRVNNGRV